LFFEQGPVHQHASQVTQEEHCGAAHQPARQPAPSTYASSRAAGRRASARSGSVDAGGAARGGAG